MADLIKIKLEPDAAPMAIRGRFADTLRRLLDAGDIGVTVGDFPAGSRLSHYVHVLRKRGLKIDTATEFVGGRFPCNRGRYRLQSQPIVVDDNKPEAA